jgi:hypothetical protein
MKYLVIVLLAAVLWLRYDNECLREDIALRDDVIEDNKQLLKDEHDQLNLCAHRPIPTCIQTIPTVRLPDTYEPASCNCDDVHDACWWREQWDIATDAAGDDS